VQRQFELCAETLEACEAAEAGGADRIELCAGLGEGGVSPSRGFLKAALLRVKTPVHVLVRPRAGGFVFTEHEFQAMCNDMDDGLDLAAAGFVVGLMTAEGAVDADRVERLVERAAGRPITFHRAIDRARDLPLALEMVIALGCSRVLTSGGKPTVTQGRHSLEQLCAQAAGRIRIAAGGGVTLANASSLLEIAGLDLHGSLRSRVTKCEDDVLWTSPSEEVSAHDVRRMTALVHAAAERGPLLR
jgi:copper homeostasis protein